jgi:hypothetical protein
MWTRTDRWALPCLAWLVPFVYFAALRRYYLFNGDHAIQIIMAHYFRWESADFYYWGQNRLGSLIPLLLLLPIQVFKWPALLSAVVCALALYLFGLALLVMQARGPAEKLAAILSFFLFPLGTYSFLLYTGHPYTPAMLLVLGAFTVAFAAPATHARMFVTGSLLAVGCWVSEASAAAIPPLLLLLYERRKLRNVTLPKLATMLAGITWIVPFTIYWRRQIGYAGHDAEYLLFATPEMLWAGILKFLPQFSLMVNSEQHDKGALAWIATAPIILVNPLILWLRRSWVDEAPNSRVPPLLTFIALHNCVYFAIILVSRHSYFGSGEIQRYWVPVIMYSIYALFVLSARALRQRRPGGSALGGATLIAAVALALLVNHKWPGHSGEKPYQGIRDKWRDVKLVREHGATHVTSDYWRALPLNVLSDFEILAVPSDFSRTQRFKPEFSKKARRRNPQDYMKLQ